jgi:hypothetical protein
MATFEEVNKPKRGGEPKREVIKTIKTQIFE